MNSTIDAKDVANRLSVHTYNLCLKYLSAGHKEGNYWVVGDINNTKPKPNGGSCKVNLCYQSGYAVGYWHDYSTNESGDMLDLVTIAVCNGDKKAGFKYALKNILDISSPCSTVSSYSQIDASSQPPLPPHPDNADTSHIEQANVKTKIDNARKMYKAGDNNIHQTPVKDYLESRAIEILAIPHPLQIAYLPKLRHYTHGKDFMGMLAPIRNADNQITAVHRTYLITHKGITRKIKNKAKLCYGVVKGNFIALRKDFFKVQPTKIYMTEGIEDALSLLFIAPDIHVITCVSLSNMGNVILPSFVKEVVLVQDNDSNKKIQIQLETHKGKLCHNHPHIKLFFIKPLQGYKDFNAWLCDTKFEHYTQHSRFQVVEGGKK